MGYKGTHCAQGYRSWTQDQGDRVISVPEPPQPQGAMFLMSSSSPASASASSQPVVMSTVLRVVKARAVAETGRRRLASVTTSDASLGLVARHFPPATLPIA